MPSGARSVAALSAAGVALALVALSPLLLAGAGGHEAGASLTSPPRARPPAAEGDPVRIRIPAIGVSVDLVSLGLNPDGTLEVPDYHEAGWYAGGARPGATGPAVIAAHLDSTTGPAVFHELARLRPRDAVHVDYGNATVTFRVRESASFAKSEFPTVRVYGPTPAPELRLVTCDGAFDRRSRSYDANLVVWADLGSEPLPGLPAAGPPRAVQPVQTGSSG